MLRRAVPTVICICVASSQLGCSALFRGGPGPGSTGASSDMRDEVRPRQERPPLEGQEKSPLVDEAEQTKGLSLSGQLELDFLSRYAFRGFAMSKAPVFQPYAYLECGPLALESMAYANLSNRDPHRGRFNEYDFSAYYMLETGKLTVEPAFTYYEFASYVDGAADTGEATVTLYYPVGPVEVSFLQSLDVMEYRGYYYASLSLEYTKAVRKHLSCEMKISFDFGDNPRESDDTHVVVFPQLSMYCYVHKGLYIRPHVEFSRFLHSDFEPDEDNIVSYGLAIGLEF